MDLRAHEPYDLLRGLACEGMALPQHQAALFAFLEGVLSCEPTNGTPLVLMGRGASAWVRLAVRFLDDTVGLCGTLPWASVSASDEGDDGPGTRLAAFVGQPDTLVEPTLWGRLCEQQHVLVGARTLPPLWPQGDVLPFALRAAPKCCATWRGSKDDHDHLDVRPDG